MTFRPLTALALIAVIATGCSATPTDTETGSATETAAPKSKAVRFSECMRQNGVSAFPDPEPSGELTIDGVLNGSGIDAESAAWKQAISACKALQPSGFTGRKATPKEQDQRLLFAQCIREHGVTDFPDPAPGDPLVDTNKIPSSNRAGGMDVLNAAMQQCSDVVPDGVGER